MKYPRKQKPNIPEIKNCAICSAAPALEDDLSYNSLVCYVCHNTGCSNYCKNIVYVGNRHKAANRWNKLQDQI